MKQLSRLVTILVSLFFVSCNFQPQPSDRLIDLLDQFENPSREFRSAPFWVWNDSMSTETIDRMLTEFKEQGFGGAFLHPRYGMTTEYLSEEWFDLFEHSVKKGKELDLNIWIYDENSYPSGFAGGHTPAQMPESFNQGVGLRPFAATLLPDTIEKMALVLKEENGTLENITGKVGDYAGKEGSYYFYEKTFFPVSGWNAGHSYVDLMVKGVTEKFIEITMTGYQNKAKADFGTYVPGVFTDEPEIASPGGSFRWTPDLFPLFKETYGYDLETNFASLHAEIGDFKRVRHNYHQLLLKLFIDRWAKVWFDYCEQNNLVWTGHYWEHNWPRVHGGPDNMAMAAYQQMPGIDMLFNQYNDSSATAQFGNVRSVKEVASVANQLGRKRVLSETYGGAGWELTFKDMKRLGDWEYALGVNFLNQHLSHASYAGVRKYDYPPMFTSAAPWWESYRQLNDYYARLSAALSKGEQCNDILVIEPTTSIWLYHEYPRGTEKVRDIGQSFQQLITNMSKALIEYDLGCEDIIKTHGRVAGDRFCVGKRYYSTVVVPAQTENLEAKTFDLLKKFHSGGGDIIAFSTPSRIDGVENEEVKSFFALNSIVKGQNDSQQTLKSLMANKGVAYTTSGEGTIYHQRRQYRDGQLFFFVNSSMDHPVEATVTLPISSLMELDAMTGKHYLYPCDNNGGTFSIKLEPAESILLFSSKKKMVDEERRSCNAVQIVESLSPVTIERNTDNVLTIDYVDLSVGGATWKNIHTLEAGSEVFKNAGFKEGNPWFMAIQYKQNILERDTFSTHGFTVAYRFVVDAGNSDFGNVKLAVERPWLYTIKLNGQVVAPKGKDFIFDKDILLIPTEGRIKNGENTVELAAAKFSVHAEIEPIYLIGDFDVKATDKRFVLCKAEPKTELKSWNEMGWPFYPYGVNYTKQYKVDKTEGKQYIVKADAWKGTVAEVYVNGEKVGIIYSNPYTLNITQALKTGENSIQVRVIGGMENMIGPFHSMPNGLTGPHSWRNVNTVSKPTEYRITPYGMTGDFVLMTN